MCKMSRNLEIANFLGKPHLALIELIHELFIALRVTPAIISCVSKFTFLKYSSDLLIFFLTFSLLLR